MWLAADGVGVEVMCQVNDCYSKAGLGAGEVTTNRHDYFGVELEFVSWFARRIAAGEGKNCVLGGISRPGCFFLV